MRTFDILSFVFTCVNAYLRKIVKCTHSFGRDDFCWTVTHRRSVIVRRNHPKIGNLFQDSDRTSTSTEINNTSYESPIIQLFGARRMGAWHHHGGATPTSRKTVCYFFFSRPWRPRGLMFSKKKLIGSNVYIS